MSRTMKIAKGSIEPWTAEQYRLMYPELMDAWNVMNNAIEKVESSNKIAVWVGKLYDTKSLHYYQELINKANVLVKEYKLLYKLLYDPTIDILQNHQGAPAQLSHFKEFKMLSQYEIYLCILSQEYEDVNKLWKLAVESRFKFENYRKKTNKLRYILVQDRIMRIALQLKQREERRYRALDMLVKLLWNKEEYRSC